MSVQTLFLNAGQTLTVTADANSSGYLYRLAASAGDGPFALTTIGQSTTTTYGPFAQDRRYAIDSQAGAITFTATVVDFPAAGAIDSFTGISASYSTVPSDRTLTVAANTQSIAYGAFTVTGQLTIAGEMRFGAWPF